MKLIGVLCNNPSAQMAAQYDRIAEDLRDCRFVLLYRRSDSGNAAWTPAFASKCDNEVLPQSMSRWIPKKLRSYVNGDIRPVLERYNFDAMVIHGFYDSTAVWQAYAWCRRNRKPCFIRCDTNVDRDGALLRRLSRGWIISSRIRQATGVMYIGTQNRRFYELFVARPERLYMVPWEIDYDVIESAYQLLRAGRNNLREEFGISDDKCVIITAGRLLKLKGFDMLLPVIGRLEQSGLDVELLIAGEGPYRLTIEKIVERHKIQARLLGNLDRNRLVKAMIAADVFVLSSYSEAWGLVVNEAALCGLPLVVSDAVGAWPDLITPGENGFVYPRGDGKALFDTLARLVSDSGLRARMGQKSRQILDNWRKSFPAAEGFRKALNSVFVDPEGGG